MSFADEVLAETGSLDYTGEALEPEITVNGGGRTLRSGVDYTVGYSGNTDAGQDNEFMLDYFEMVPKSVYGIGGDSENEMEDDL